MTRVKAMTVIGLALGLSACNEDHPFANGTPVGERCGSGPVEDFAGRAACRKGDTIETLIPAAYCDFNYPLVTRSDAAFLASGAGIVSCVYVGELRKVRELGADEAKTLVSDSARARAEADAKAAAAARARMEAEARARADADAKAAGGVAAAMVSIPAGSFQMGCSPGDWQCRDWESPAHQVTIGPFLIGKYEVTQAQWQWVMGANPSRFKGPPDRPVENVSWNDAQEFLKRLNSKGTGKAYRLPTEAECEYAARAGTTTPYWWGMEIGNSNGNANHRHEATNPVGSFKPNAFGLYDTAGNVWEWVQDCWHDDYTGAPTDGSEWHNNCLPNGRVLRGGSWSYDARYSRGSNRNGPDPDSRDDSIGLRLAQDL